MLECSNWKIQSSVTRCVKEVIPAEAHQLNLCFLQIWLRRRRMRVFWPSHTLWESSENTLSFPNVPLWIWPLTNWFWPNLQQSCPHSPAPTHPLCQPKNPMMWVELVHSTIGSTRGSKRNWKVKLTPPSTLLVSTFSSGKDKIVWALYFNLDPFQWESEGQSESSGSGCALAEHWEHLVDAFNQIRVKNTIWCLNFNLQGLLHIEIMTKIKLAKM